MKFDSKPLQEHLEVPLADDGRWEQIVAHWARRQPNSNTKQSLSDGNDRDGNRCYVVSITPRQAARSEARLAEILGLVRAQGDDIVGHEVLRIVRPEPKMLLKSGAARHIADRANECGADLVVVDAELSPSQMRNLEDAMGFAVCDREAVILNVFQRHAKTRRARIQVEIAHLQYLRPRIRGLGLVMDQQAGGVVGARGAGETASELLARRLDGRLAMLRKAFARIVQAGGVQRRRRETCKRIALVGYTNAGKTSVMNALTSAALSAADRPFETLDTTSRCLTRHGGDVLISDTVGFIRNLPEQLFASFETTLAEIQEASLIVLVIDVADAERDVHLRTTETVLAKLGANHVRRLYVFNKSDRLETTPTAAELKQLSRGQDHMLMSSRDAAAVAQLKDRLLRTVRADQLQATVFLPYGATAAIAMVYAKCRVIEVEPSADGMHFTVHGAAHVIAELKRASEKVQR